VTDDSQQPIATPTNVAALTSIATLTFDTADWPPEERFDAWCRHNSASTFTQVEQGAFSARGRIWLLDGIVVSEHWVDPFRGHRDRALARDAAMDHLMLILPYDGTTRVRGRGMNVLCRPGDVAILDYRRPLATENSRQHGVAISIRRTLLEERCGPIDLHGRLPRSPEVRLLLDHVRGLVFHLPSIRQTNVATVTRILRDVIAMAMPDAAGSAPDGSGSAPDGADHPDLRGRIVAHIAGCPPGRLSVPSLLREVGATRPTVYRLFRADGGLIAYDRKRRLAMVHRALCTGDRRSATEIGAAFGFGDPANLSRLFRARYGYTMTQLRRGLALLAPAGPASDDVALTYRQAVASLSRN